MLELSFRDRLMSMNNLLFAPITTFVITCVVAVLLYIGVLDKQHGLYIVIGCALITVALSVFVFTRKADNPRRAWRRKGVDIYNSDYHN